MTENVTPDLWELEVRSLRATRPERYLIPTTRRRQRGRQRSPTEHDRQNAASGVGTGMSSRIRYAPHGCELRQHVGGKGRRQDLAAIEVLVVVRSRQRCRRIPSQRGGRDTGLHRLPLSDEQVPDRERNRPSPADPDLVGFSDADIR